MSLTPITLNGVIQRLDDVSQIKQHEQNKPVVDQQHISQEVTKEQELKYTKVQETEKNNSLDNELDAKDEGQNKYKKKKHKKEKEEEKDVNKVTVKSKDTGSHFDMTI
ncbi:hypothetical protein SAMN04487761_10191 [Lachnospiraceae bacterium C7]|nr:hypothetical protein SAMN04487761_10191 [Lachnospiraceae bacterium C7]